MATPEQQPEPALTEDLPEALLARILGMAGLWGSSTAGWSVCQAWNNAMMQNPGAVAEALVQRHGGDLSAALLTATMHGRAVVVRALLTAGADVDTAWTPQQVPPADVGILMCMFFSGNPLPTTPLWLASKRGHLEVVRVLLAAGATVDSLSSYPTTSPLWARAMGEALARALVGATPDLVKTVYGSSPLWAASHAGHVEVVRALLAACADADLATTGTTPLWIASQDGHVEVVRALLAGGAQVDLVRNEDGSSPLWAASDSDRVDVVHAHTLPEMLKHCVGRRRTYRVCVLPHSGMNLLAKQDSVVHSDRCCVRYPCPDPHQRQQRILPLPTRLTPLHGTGMRARPLGRRA